MHVLFELSRVWIISCMCVLFGLSLVWIISCMCVLFELSLVWIISCILGLFVLSLVWVLFWKKENSDSHGESNKKKCVFGIQMVPFFLFWEWELKCIGKYLRICALWESCFRQNIETNLLYVENENEKWHLFMNECLVKFEISHLKEFGDYAWI